jgi:hypothetical protein
MQDIRDHAPDGLVVSRSKIFLDSSERTRLSLSARLAASGATTGTAQLIAQIRTEYSQPVAMRNSTGWSTGARKSAGTSSRRGPGITLITLGAFALVAAGTATQVDRATLAAVVLTLIGVVGCLAGWRMLVVARRSEHSSD